MKKHLLALLCILQLSGFAQNGFTTYSSSIALSIPVPRPTALLIDNAGNKWMGLNMPPASNVALAKFDNTSWTYYSTTSTPALPSNSVTALAKDNAGSIWIGTDRGLVRFTGTTFITYTTLDGLPSNTITCIETVAGSVYIGTSAGLSRFDNVNFINYNVANGKLPDDNITAIKAESANVIWLGGVDRLVKFNINNTFTTTSYQDNTITPSSGKINCIYIDGQNKKWLGTTTLGVLMYSGTSFVNVDDVYPTFGGGLGGVIYDLAEGQNNGVAAKMVDKSTGASSYGIIEFAPNNKVYQYFYPVNNVCGDYLEKDGASWFMTRRFTTNGKLMLIGFNKTNYTRQLGEINNHNFKFLDVNNINAAIANRGDMHWDMTSYVSTSFGFPCYEVPKGSGKSSNFVSALWIGGLDNGNQLHGAAQTYRQFGNDFWPGPLDTLSAMVDSATARNYDQIWKISYSEINDFIINFNNGNVQNATYIPSEDLVSWPSKGSGNFSRNLAPFVDVNNNGIYDPLTGGDYPKIKGDQALYYIFNDMVATRNTSCTPMGIEVHAMAYAYGCTNTTTENPALAYTTFYNYKIINRSASNYHDVYVSLWNDADLGYYGDDYVGTNVAGNYGYVYNADNFDETVGFYPGYGSYPPAQGFAIVKGPLAPVFDGIDNDNDGVIDEAGEECKLNRLTTFKNPFPGVPVAETMPVTCTEYYNYLTGKWKDGTNFTCGGYGYGGSTLAKWVYPGDPNNPGMSTDPAGTCGYWTEGTAGNTPDDRRLIPVSGPFNLGAGQMTELEYAYVTSFDSTSVSNSHLLAVNKLKTDVQNINSFYNLANKPVCTDNSVGIRTISKEDHFTVYPNPAKSLLTVHSTQGNVKTVYELVDVLGKLVLKGESSVNDFTIQVSDLKQGIYFLRLSSNGRMAQKKIVKE